MVLVAHAWAHQLLGAVAMPLQDVCSCCLDLTLSLASKAPMRIPGTKGRSQFLPLRKM